MSASSVTHRGVVYSAEPRPDGTVDLLADGRLVGTGRLHLRIDSDRLLGGDESSAAVIFAALESGFGMAEQTSEERPQLTGAQRSAQLAADRDGRELVTLIDGRVAIILRPHPEEQTADALGRVIRALEVAPAAEPVEP